jgi:hypothetical protein
MSDNEHDHGHEDHSICITVGIFFICTIILLYFIAQ